MQHLSKDILQDIFLFQHTNEIVNTSGQVCKHWKSVLDGSIENQGANENSVIWYRLFLRDLIPFVSQDELDNCIATSRKLSETTGGTLSKGDLQRMRRMKKKNKTMTHTVFVKNEQYNHWKRMYWYFWNKMRKADHLTSKMYKLHGIVRKSFLWKRFQPAHICELSDLKHETNSAESYICHTVHCQHCRLAISTTELTVSKKHYIEFYGSHRAEYYPLKLLPVSIFNYDTGQGSVFPMEFGQRFEDLIKFEYLPTHRFLYWYGPTTHDESDEDDE